MAGRVASRHHHVVSSLQALVRQLPLLTEGIAAAASGAAAASPGGLPASGAGASPRGGIGSGGAGSGARKEPLVPGSVELPDAVLAAAVSDPSIVTEDPALCRAATARGERLLVATR
eukprot:13065-Chlamydomonas_euryale.AAC.1